MSVGLLERAHLVGIGGAGMSGIARILLARGRTVSGSDARDSRTVLALRAQGARIALGHEATHLDQFEQQPTSIVVSTAIKEDNPELRAARERGIPVLRRAEALAALMSGHRVVCVAGTHGKTSTTSMLTVALQHCRLDPSFAIGGDLNDSKANAHHGEGGMFIAEADESDGSFLLFSPSIAVVTSVEPDHLDHHGSISAYTEVFDQFVQRIETGGEHGGVLIICADDPGAAALAERMQGRPGLRIRRYGKSVTEPGDARIVGYRPDGQGALVTVDLIGREEASAANAAANSAPIGMDSGADSRVDNSHVDVAVSVPGEHMAFNAVAALLAAEELGADQQGVLEGLAAFGGVSRRFELKGQAAGIRVYDDYAHHPTEVAAQLRAARVVAGHGRLIVIFQPHLYSRTEAFAGEFAVALGLADEVIVLDVYGAREDPRPGVTGALVAEQIGLPAEQVRFEPSMAEVAPLIAELARSGDLVLTMGAGDVTMLGEDILSELERSQA